MIHKDTSSTTLKTIYQGYCEKIDKIDGRLMELSSDSEEFMELKRRRIALELQKKEVSEILVSRGERDPSYIF